jgi:hypothetical protein
MLAMPNSSQTLCGAAKAKIATSLVTERRLLVTHRTNLIVDRVCMVDRSATLSAACFPP